MSNLSHRDADASITGLSSLVFDASLRSVWIRDHAFSLDSGEDAAQWIIQKIILDCDHGFVTWYAEVRICLIYWLSYPAVLMCDVEAASVLI